MKRLVLIIFFLILSTGIFGQIQTEEKPTEKAKPTPISFAIVVDNSGSIRTILEDIIDVVKKTTNKINSIDETSVIRFVSSDKISIEQDLTQDKTLIEDAIDLFYCEFGKTAVFDAVYLANEMLSKKGKNTRKVIILVTDGDDRDSFYRKEEIFESLKKSKVEVFSIGFINQISYPVSNNNNKINEVLTQKKRQQARAFLETLAKETNGQSFIVEKKEDFALIPDKVFSVIRPSN